MRWKKTDIETKAKIADLRINKWMLGSDIAEELDMPERTVNKIIDTDIAEVCRDSTLIQGIIQDATEASKIMGEITLTMAKDIKQRQIQVNEWAEWMKPTTDEIRTLNATVAEWFKRSQLLSWQNTENIWISWYDLLQDIKSGKLSKEQAYEAMQKAKSV